ncbi:MAG: tRNA guanosine(15) transglycosylase TgtA [Candidatus Heimdallarchaeaceae archaeon]
MVEIISSDLHSRLGSFKLKDETISIPTLVPVVDPKNNIIHPQEIMDKFGFNLLITSSYLFLKRYGIPDGTKTIHEILEFKGKVMMDSGAYQILAYGDVDIDPIQSLQIQSLLKTDIGVILDVPTPPIDNYEIAKRKVEQTINRIEISLEHIKDHPETIWTLPIQGGKNTSLIKYYINNVKEKKYLSFFGFHALGSVVPIMENYDYSALFSMIYTARKNLPHNIPLHIFGAGHPMIFPFIAALGADTFDSAAYILFAKDSRYMTPFGTNSLTDMKELPCSCEVCSKWTPKELRESKKNEQIRNLALHNLHVSSTEIKVVREAIREGRLWDLLEQRAFAHPKLYNAFKMLQSLKDKTFLETCTPITKSVGVKIYDSNSFFRPELSKMRKKIIENYQPQKERLLVLLFSGARSPIEIFMYKKALKEKLEKKMKETDIVLFLPFIGLLPLELIETYPFSQFVFSKILSYDLINLAVEVSNNFIEKLNYKEVVIQNEDKENITEEMENYITAKLIKK